MEGESSIGAVGVEACGRCVAGRAVGEDYASFWGGILVVFSVEVMWAALISSTGALLASVVWGMVVRFAVHGSRKGGGSDHRVSSTALLRFRDSIVPKIRRLQRNGGVGQSESMKLSNPRMNYGQRFTDAKTRPGEVYSAHSSPAA